MNTGIRLGGALDRATPRAAMRAVVYLALACLAGCAGDDVTARPDPDGSAVVAVDVTPDAPAGALPRGDATPEDTRDAPPDDTPHTCATQALLRAPGAWNDQVLAADAPYYPNCQETLVRSRFYRVLVPPMHRMVVTTSESVAARVQESCASARCVAGSAPWRAEAQHTFTNAHAYEESVVVAVSARTLDPGARSFSLSVTFAPLSPSLICAEATPLTGEAVWDFSADALFPVFDDGRTPTPPSGHFYRATVPAGQRLVVTPTPGTDAWILVHCAAATTSGVRWRDPVERSTGGAWRNTYSSAVDAVVALSPNSSVETVGARFDVGEPAPAAACATAPRLSSDTSQTSLSTRDSGDRFSACMFTEAQSAPALWWRVRVPAGYRVTATARLRGEASEDGMGVAFVRRCDDRACLAEGSNGYATSAQASWANTAVHDDDVLLAVAGEAPLFDLDVAFARITASSACATAPTLTPGVTLTGQRFDASGPDAVACDLTRPAPTLYYRVAVPADHQLGVAITATGASAHAALVDRCDAAQCLRGRAFAPEMPPLRWTHQDAGTREVIVSVSRGDATFGHDGSFDLLALLTPTPANAHCATPRELTSGVPVTVEDEYAHDLASDCWGGRTPSLFHRIAVPPGQQLRVTATSGEGRTTVRLLSSCDAARCLEGAAPTPGTVVWTNLDATPRAVLIALGDTITTRTVTLTATVAPPPADTRCETAPREALPTYLRAENLGDARTADPACSATRPSIYRTLRVPAHQRLRVTAVALYGSVWLSLIGSCGGTCLSASRAARDVMSWSNLSDEDRDVVLAVESESAGSTVDLSLSLDPIAPDGACVTAPTIAPGEPRALTWTDAFEEAPTCGGPTPAWVPSLYHAVDVPPGLTVTASITGSMLRPVGVRILAGCGAPTCLSYWSTGPDLGPVTTTWRNTGDVAQRVYVATSSSSTSLATAPTASLRVSVAP